MFFDLDAATQGEWFPFQSSHIDPVTGEPVFEPPASDARVQIRSMTPFFEDLIAKRKRMVDNIYNPKTRSMDRVSYYPEPSFADAQREREDAYDYAIIAFENIKDAKTKKVIACTRENKIALMKIPVFDRFFARCQQLLSASGVKEAEEAVKNSLAGSETQTSKPDPE